MNITLFRKELREARWKLVLGTVILTATAVGMPLVYDFLKDLISIIPQEQLERYGGLMPTGVFENFTMFLWSQWNAKNLTQISAIMAVLVGMNLVAGEVSGQSMAFLLARPISRRSVFITKALAGIAVMVFMVWVATLVMVFVVKFTPYTVEVGRLFAATLVTTVGVIVILSLSVLLSTLFDEPVKAGGAAVVILLLIAASNWVKVLARVNLFNHMSAAQYMITGTFPVIPVLAMSLVAVLLLVTGMHIFGKKEF
jgi:ABC-type transport system involved in multi-copper enzyme maturation permease subunit